MNKSHFWVTQYNKQGDLIEIKILDGSESTIERWKFNIADKKTATRVMRILKEQYGFSPEIPAKPVGILEKEKDLNWLRDNE